MGKMVFCNNRNCPIRAHCNKSIESPRFDPIIRLRPDDVMYSFHKPLYAGGAWRCNGYLRRYTAVSPHAIKKTKTPLSADKKEDDTSTKK